MSVRGYHCDMSIDGSEITHVCVRCGHANEPVASFCVECGFDLNSALQRDYDSYRDMSRGELTLSESDGIPVSIIRDLAEESGLDSPPPPSPTPAPPPSRPLSRPLGVQGDTTDIESKSVQAMDTQEGETIKEPLPDLSAMEERARRELEKTELPLSDIDSAFAPSRAAPADQPKSRPVHENLRKGVTTYVHASERGFRRPEADEGRGLSSMSFASLLAFGSLIIVLILVLTR